VWGKEQVKIGPYGLNKDFNKRWHGYAGEGKKQEEMKPKEIKQGQFCQLCGAWRGALGLEPNPDLYVRHIVQIFREVRRVLRDDGTVWLNIADSYAGSWGSHKAHHKTNGLPQKGLPVYGKDEGWTPLATPQRYGLKPKDLCLIPERLAIALQQDGWWIRCRIPWIKLNGMPSSQQDRPTVSHEYIFLMSKAKRYYYDQEGVKVPISEGSKERWGDRVGQRIGQPDKWHRQEHTEGESNFGGDSKGRYRRTTDWWFDSLSELFSDEFMAFALPTEPFTMEMCQQCKQVYNRSEYNRLEVLIIPAEESDTGKEQKKRICIICGSTDDWLSHFATFGEKLVTPMILAGTSPQACQICGAPWTRVIKKRKFERAETQSQLQDGIHERSGAKSLATMRQAYRKEGLESPPSPETLGWKPTCKCAGNDGSGKCIVLDPFAGACTTGVMAKKLDRSYVMIDANPDYCVMGEKRIVDTDTEEDDRQLDMFSTAQINALFPPHIEQAR